jgi:hypothetical protein
MWISTGTSLHVNCPLVCIAFNHNSNVQIDLSETSRKSNQMGQWTDTVQLRVTQIPCAKVNQFCTLAPEICGPSLTAFPIVSLFRCPEF